MITWWNFIQIHSQNLSYLCLKTLTVINWLINFLLWLQKIAFINSYLHQKNRDILLVILNLLLGKVQGHAIFYLHYLGIYTV